MSGNPLKIVHSAHWALCRRREGTKTRRTKPAALLSLSQYEHAKTTRPPAYETGRKGGTWGGGGRK